MKKPKQKPKPNRPRLANAGCAACGVPLIVTSTDSGVELSVPAPPDADLKVRCFLCVKCGPLVSNAASTMHGFAVMLEAAQSFVRLIARLARLDA